MGFPRISNLQFFVLSELMSDEAAGHELRAKLKAEGSKSSGPAFYQLMARLEEQKLVKGRYRNVDIDGQICRERLFTITGVGRKAVLDFELFASRRLGLEGLGG